MHQLLPNEFPAVVSTSSAAIKLVAHDGTLYDTVALCLAASKRPYGQINSQDPEKFIQHLTLTMDNGAGADAAGCLIHINTNTAPADANGFAYYLSKYEPLVLNGPIRTVWIKKTTAGDILRLAGRG